MKYVGENIKATRIAKSYSEAYMAFCLSISAAHYTRLENNPRKMTINRLADIADILNVPLKELLQRHDP